MENTEHICSKKKVAVDFLTLSLISNTLSCLKHSYYPEVLCKNANMDFNYTGIHCKQSFTITLTFIMITFTGLK